MPNLSRIWTLYPIAEGRPDTASESCWIERLALSSEPLQGHLQDANPPTYVSPVGGSAEPRVARRKSFYHVNGRGRLVQVDAGDPISFARIRIRSRDDLNTDSVFVDEAGRQWVVETFADATGRGRFLEVELASYKPGPQSASASFTPPAGWTLQEDGQPVQVLTVGEQVRSDDFYREYLGVRFQHTKAWTAAAFAGTVFNCEADGKDRRLVLVGADPSEGLGAGENWPGMGAVLLDSNEQLTKKLPIGATIRIKSD